MVIAAIGVLMLCAVSAVVGITRDRSSRKVHRQKWRDTKDQRNRY